MVRAVLLQRRTDWMIWNTAAARSLLVPVLVRWRIGHGKYWLSSFLSVIVEYTLTRIFNNAEPVSAPFADIVLE